MRRAPPASGVASGARRAPNALRIGDVADVVEGFPPPIGDAVINDGRGLLLIVEKQPDGNTLQVTRDVEAALAALKPGLPDVDVDTDHLPAGDVHRDVAAEPEPRAAHRLRAGDRSS